MAKKTKKQIEAEQIRIAAEKATKEAMDEMNEPEFESPEERDLSFVSDDDDATPDFAREQKDVFVDGRIGAKKRFKSANFRIYRDEKWLGTKRGDYSWEQLQKEYGGGNFRVVAVDADNKFITSQGLEIEYPEDWADKAEAAPIPTVSAPTTFEMLEVMKENAREAEAKANSQQAGLATIMSSVMQAQQQSNQMIMQMMVESSKQTQSLLLAMMSKSDSKGPDPMLTLVTTLLTKDKPKEGMGFETVLKLLADKERDTRTSIEKQYEMIEKKADSLADMKVEAMSAGEGEAEESGLKGLIKGFVPVITQMIANNQAGQPTAEQMQQMQEQRRLQSGNQALDQGFIDQQASRPMVSAPNPRPRPPAPRTQVVNPGGAVVPNMPHVPQGPITVQNGPIPPGAGGTHSGVIQTDIAGAPIQADQVVNPAPEPISTQELVLTARQKEQVFDAVAPDIGRAMIEGTAASKTALIVLDKLEKEGLTRQTIAKAYRVEDFYGYALQYGLPDEAKPWLKEFYESIQKMAGTVPLRKPTNTFAPATAINGKHVNGNGSSKTISAKRDSSPTPRARTQSRGHSKDL